MPLQRTGGGFVFKAAEKVTGRVGERTVVRPQESLQKEQYIQSGRATCFVNSKKKVYMYDDGVENFE